jgi:UDP-N-acetylglucosamine transferase subunit ALG13
LKLILKKQPYVLVTVGSTDFDPLIQAVDRIALSFPIKGIMQIGSGKYKPINLPYFRFSPSLDPYYKKATVAIAHGGLATTMEILKMGLPLISVSNSDRYDNHQIDLLETMENEGYLIWCKQLEDLQLSIETALNKELRRYSAPECNIHIYINEYLNR